MRVYITLALLNILVWRYTCNRLILGAEFSIQIYIL
jgi:hypothetical protein